MALLIDSRAHTRIQIEADITAYLSTLPDWERWKDMFQSSVGKVVIELLSGISEMLIYKADTRLLENYLFTALTPEASYLVGDMLGYNINRKSSSEGVVKLTFSSALTSQVILSDGYLIYEETPLVVVGNHTIPIGATEALINIAQGEFNYLLFTSTPDESYSLDGESVSTGTLTGVNFERLLIDEGFEIENAETEKSRISLYMCTADTFGNLTITDSVDWFTGVADITSDNVLLRTYYLGGIYILLGDGIYGKDVASSDLFLVKYLTTLGRSVSIPENTSLGNIYVSTLSGQVQATMTVSAAITGGSDEDSIDKVKMVVAGYLSAQERAVTLADWQYIVLAYQGIVNCQIQKDDDLCCTVQVVAITENMTDETHYDWSHPDTYWDSVREAALLSYLDDYKMISTNVLIIDPSYKDLSINISVILNNSSVDMDDLQTDIKEVVKSQCYVLGDTLYPTEIVKDIAELDDTNITRVDITQLRVDGVAQVSPYDEITLDWGVYIRTKDSNITVSFTTPT